MTENTRYVFINDKAVLTVDCSINNNYELLSLIKGRKLFIVFFL
ncbi:hypothetical protein HW555_013699 [Spodoptera exigua]|uniref:Uncharacterized protein n=1 Tax=Spodoptera exigua TaxID=7107 RepID=A0A835G2X2_SPOEX|nr:hypothetical protein HW555_013699 [Spodoptera exigua]